MKLKQIANLLNSKKYKWTVTGAAGFIGSHLVEFLLENNQKVIQDKPAEESGDKYHGVSKFNIVTGEQAKSKSNTPSYSSNHEISFARKKN